MYINCIYYTYIHVLCHCCCYCCMWCVHVHVLGRYVELIASEDSDKVLVGEPALFTGPHYPYIGNFYCMYSLYSFCAQAISLLLHHFAISICFSAHSAHSISVPLILYHCCAPLFKWLIQLKIWNALLLFVVYLLFARMVAQKLL